MNTINKLAELIAKFPGIGPRQAKRIVYFLLRQNSIFLEELAKTMLELKKDTHLCTSCYRYFTPNSSEKICSTCGSNRQTDTLMIVEKKQCLQRTLLYTWRYSVITE